MAKVIIGIHGLGNKPPKRLLERWWRASIREGLRRIDRDRVFFKLELVYWASYLHPLPLNPAVTDPADPLYIDEPYLPALGVPEHKPSERRRKMLDFIEKELDRLLLNDDLSVNFNGISDFIISHFFSDLDVYYRTVCRDIEDPSCKVRQIIITKTRELLHQYRNDDILLVGHSMGSIIAYEVLMQPGDQVVVDSLVTMGSPLGIPVIMSKIAAGLDTHPSQGGKLTTPSAVTRQWANLSDLNDRIAFNYNLSDDYGPNAAGISATDMTVVNDYRINGRENQHKIYGYLRTPEFARIADNFLTHNRTAPHHRLMNGLQRTLAKIF